MSVGAALIIIAVIIVVGMLIAIFNAIRLATHDVDITNSDIRVTANRLPVKQNCTIEFQWTVTNRKIRRPHMVTITTTLTIAEHGKTEEKKQDVAYAYWSGTMSKTVSWSSPGKKVISAEITVDLPDGTSVSGTGSGSVEVYAAEEH